MSKKNRRAREQRQPTWHPISALPRFASLIDAHLAQLVEELDALREARPQPYVLDDATVKRVVEVHRETLDTATLYVQQLARWRQEVLTESQRREVERLIGQVHRLFAVTREILALAEELARGTIDRVLAMSDEEAGLAALAGLFGPGGVRQPKRVADPAAVDVTEEVFARIRERLTPAEQHRLAIATVPYDEDTRLLFLTHMMPAAVDASVARSAAGAGRGMIVADQTGSEWAFRWVPQAGCMADLSMATPETRREVAEIVEVYDPEAEAVIVLLTRTSLRAMWASPDGTYRSPGSRPVEPPPSPVAEGSTVRPEGTTDGSGVKSRWEAISYLPGAAEYIETHLDAFETRLTMFQTALGKPHAIGSEALRDSLAQHQQELRDAQVPNAQLAQWLREPLTVAQRTEVERLGGQMERWRKLCREIIELVEELLRQNATQAPDRLLAAAFYIELQCRPLDSLSPRVRSGLPFVLPPEVTVSRVEADENQRVYRFEHRDLDLLGQLRVARAPGGIHMDVWVNDEPGSGGGAARRRRRAIFVALTDRLMEPMGAVGMPRP